MVKFIRFAFYILILQQLSDSYSYFPPTLSADESIHAKRLQGNLDSGLVAYYPFNGNALDESGNGNHGYVHGAKSTADRFGAAEQAYYFDGVDDYIRIPFSSDFDFSDEKQISFGFWADTMFVGFALSTAGQFGFFLSVNGKEGIRTGIAASYYWIFIRDRVHSRENWFHCFVTANDKTIKLYVDGQLMKESSLYDVKWDIIKMKDIYICAENSGFRGPLLNFSEGRLDELRIYNRVLTPKEIMQLASK